MRATRSARRIHFLDEVRGLCVLLMVFYHSFYTAGYIFGVEFAAVLFDFFTPAEPFFAGLFIFICGICCNFSHSNLKRGLLLGGVAVLLSTMLWCGIRLTILTKDTMIWFGILHLLAVCILLYVLLRPTLNFMPTWLGATLCAVLFVLFWHVSPYEGSYFGIQGLFTVSTPPVERNPLSYILGLCSVGSAGDYFPLLPWLFCFLAGVYVGRWHRGFPAWMSRSHCRPLSRLGKISLWVYIAHQPIIYGLCFVIAELV